MSFNECARPSADEDHCIIKVEAAGINFLDTLMIRGKYQVQPPLPFVPGVEAAGTVVETTQASRFAIGDRVCALLDHGAFAEYASVPLAHAVKIPNDFPIRDAVAMPVIYPTAYLALKERANLQPGETVLVHAGAGGVGSAAIELARNWGARVIATAGGAGKAAVCRALGASDVIDYTREPLVERVRALTSDAGVDVIVDPVGGQVAADSLRCLAWGGRLVIVGFAGGSIAELPSNRLLLKNATALGVYWGEYRRRHPTRAAAIFAELFELWRVGRIAPLVRDVFTLAHAPQALDALASRSTVGKVVLIN